MYNATTTNANYHIILPAASATSSCCIPGDRIIKIFDDETSKRGVDMTIRDFFHKFTEEEKHFVESFDRKVSAMERKLIYACTTRQYTGTIIRVIFDFETEQYFECTEDHFLPMEVEDEFFIGYANNLSPWSYIYLYNHGKITKQKVKAVVTYPVENFEVFNLGLESHKRRGDSFYVDGLTSIIHNG